MFERCKSVKQQWEYFEDTFGLFSKSLTEAKVLEDLEFTKSSREQFTYLKEIVRREVGDLVGEASFLLGRALNLRVDGFSEGLAAARDKNGEGHAGYFYINPKGETVIRGPFDEAEAFQNGRARVCLKRECWYIDKTGQKVSKFLEDLDNKKCLGIVNL